MAIELTTEEQARVFMEEASHARQMEQESLRNEVHLANSKIQHKLELLRHAKEVLIANRSNAPLGEREVTDEEIVKYATTLQAFLNS